MNSTMYRYDEFDAKFVRDRTAQFRNQVERRLLGELSEEQFKPLRLMNGLYLQLHAYMLRVAIPYGVLSSAQMRRLAQIADRYDRGYGHFTTRQNIQFNWPQLAEVPAILDELAQVEMHAIQTSGNCIRNVTTDHWAGVAADEVLDPRPYCELLRQWSSLHPEFSYLPRKFKIAVTGSPRDRAAVKVHDIGLRMHRDSSGNPAFEVFVGGGQGRTPMIASTLRPSLPVDELLGYCTAILRIYNQYGRRDNKYKARIKILVHEIGIDNFREQVEAEYAVNDQTNGIEIAQEEVSRIARYFEPPAYEALTECDPEHDKLVSQDKDFALWVQSNTSKHKQAGYRIVNVSLKPIGGIPGDASSAQMEALADIAELFSFGEIRVSHEQNLVLPYVKISSLKSVWEKLESHDLAAPNIGRVSDIISCPGMDYCALATARSIPVAQEISQRFSDLSRQDHIGDLKIKISGCINACGHHHVGHIGILGLEKKGVENYQITLGGSADENASIGKILGPGFSSDRITDAIETIIETYLSLRTAPDEVFLDCFRRVGVKPFKEAVYASA